MYVLVLRLFHQRLMLQLRRAEHHLHDAEKPAVLLNGADKPATHDYSVVVDRIPSYRITNAGCGTGVSARCGGHRNVKGKTKSMFESYGINRVNKK